MLDRAHDQVRRVQRNLTSTLTLDLDDEAGFGGLHDDLVVQTQREAEAVEPWAQVGAGRRNDGGGRQPGRQSLRHRRCHPLDQTQLLDDGRRVDR